jgi:hypothetical protein
MLLFVLTMLCKVYSAWHKRQVVEHSFEWLMESKNQMIKFMDGCCFYIPLIDGEFQNDKSVGVPGEVDLEGKTMENPLATKHVGGPTRASAGGS